MKTRIESLIFVFAMALGVTGCAAHRSVPAVGQQQMAPQMGAAVQPQTYAGGVAYQGYTQPVVQPAPQAAPAPENPKSAPGSHSRNLADSRLEEMNGELIAAFERIVGKYGNPSTIRVFTNDPEKGQDFQKRMQLLQRVEQLKADAAALEKRVAELNGDADLRRREVASLEARIQQHRVALTAFVRMAGEAEHAFAAIGRADEEAQQNASATSEQAPAVAKARAMAIDPTGYEIKK